jgi:hypothetical protein
MAMGDYDKSKFKFSETFNNSDGKTSGSGFIGVLMGLAVVLGFILGTIGWFIGLKDVMEYMDYVLQMGLLSAGLMGLRKISGAISGRNGKSSVDMTSEKG